eukprot:sb/3464873/
MLHQWPYRPSKQPIRTRYLGHVIDTSTNLDQPERTLQGRSGFTKSLSEETSLELRLERVNRVDGSQINRKLIPDFRQIDRRTIPQLEAIRPSVSSGSPDHIHSIIHRDLFLQVYRSQTMYNLVRHQANFELNSLFNRENVHFTQVGHITFLMTMQTVNKSDTRVQNPLNQPIQEILVHDIQYTSVSSECILNHRWNALTVIKIGNNAFLNVLCNTNQTQPELAFYLTHITLLDQPEGAGAPSAVGKVGLQRFSRLPFSRVGSDIHKTSYFKLELLNVSKLQSQDSNKTHITLLDQPEGAGAPSAVGKVGLQRFSRLPFSRVGSDIHKTSYFKLELLNVSKLQSQDSNKVPCSMPTNVQDHLRLPTDTSKQPIRTRYLGHVTGNQPIRDQYFLIRSVPVQYLFLCNYLSISSSKFVQTALSLDHNSPLPNCIS